MPSFVPAQPQEEIEIVESEKPEELEIIEDPATKDKKTIFIFLVDRSGSMRGQKMDMTNNALKLFIQSLPPNSAFEIISFGTSFTASSKGKKGYVNDDKTVEKIRIEIASYSANMGGTEIYQPLRYALNDFMNDPKNYDKQIKKIFLLTDGAVSNADQIIKLASENVHRASIHTFGVGHGCSKYLVREVAKAGRGSYSFVEEADNLKGKVIRALQKAVEPAL